MLGGLSKVCEPVFKKQFGCYIEVYVVDLHVESDETHKQLGGLREVFSVLGEYGIKMNQIKCIFDVESGKLLGFIVSKRRIEAKLEKIYAIINMKLPKNLYEVQNSTSKVATLN